MPLYSGKLCSINFFFLVDIVVTYCKLGTGTENDRTAALLPSFLYLFIAVDCPRQNALLDFFFPPTLFLKTLSFFLLF